jgi:hypothetical protein
MKPVQGLLQLSSVDFNVRGFYYVPFTIPRVGTDTELDPDFVAFVSVQK